MALKTAKKTAKTVSPKQTPLTAEWTLVDALKQLDDAWEAGDMKAYVRNQGRLVGVMAETRRIVKNMYRAGYSVETIIDTMGTDALADLAIVLVLEPLFEINWRLS
jgi:uncharacterized protein YjcR